MHDYGGAGGEVGARAPNVTFLPGKRRRLNFVAILANTFGPWLAFVACFYAISGELHYYRPNLAYAIVIACQLGVFVSAGMAYHMKYREREPSWLMYFTIALQIAVAVGVIIGESAFALTAQAAIDLGNLNAYPNIDPAKDKGQQVMDAGQIYFRTGTGLDLDKSMSFKNFDEYCVAPIVNGDDQLASYDFWAVGINCCKGGTFNCGEFNNPHARAGLRLMRDDQRPFFRLAVQQAEAAYNVKATHPLFFNWMQDPLAEIGNLKAKGETARRIGILAYFLFNLFCVAFATVFFSKLGHL
eukprot:TRINITY_DN762_c0_g3_i1.p1 TRINITY_DN762_c0_g3~~TRINITY_DN762_c0_g3_i1.p1  ORF type:complete len:299 (-),score=74.61 TRINITY_DN762_c0_g3_i1:183-1079(-)